MRITQDCVFRGWPGTRCAAWSASSDPSAIFTRHWNFRFPLFQSLQNFLNGKNFHFLEDCKRHLEQFFAQKDKKLWEDGITKLPEKWQNIVEQNWICCSIKFLVKMKKMSFLFTWRSVLASLTDSFWFPTLWISLFFFLNFLLWKEIQNHR